MSGACCRLTIKAVPNASRDEIVEWTGETLKVKLRAPALEGRANEALCAYLAERLHLPRRCVTLIRGDKSRQKIVGVEGLTLKEVKSAFPASDR